MNVLSLFSGIGGIDLGLQRAGMTIVGQVEIDPWCRRVLAKHWPEVPRHDDVRTFDTWWYRGAPRPYVDLLAGGFPCQPLSEAGARRGTGDPRWLWPQFATAIRKFRPRYVFLENVPAIRNRGRDVFRDLAACGYDLQWDCLPAAALGAPHRRDRWFAVAYPARHGRGTGRPGRSAAFRAARPDGLAPQDVADPAGQGLPQRVARGAGQAGHPQGWGHALGDGGGTGPHVGHWDVEPDVGRMAHGVPDRVDRLRGLGNAVVPQVAEYVGSLITQWDRE